MTKDTKPRGYTDADYLRDKERVRRVFLKWTRVLGLSSWEECSIEYSRDPIEDEGRPGNVTTHATVYANWAYKQVAVTVDVRSICDGDDTDLEYRIVHELCHALVNETRGDDPHKSGGPHEERVVTELAMAFQRVRDMGRDEARKPPAKARRRRSHDVRTDLPRDGQSGRRDPDGGPPPPPAP